ncbi:MAG TPA: hypothetical protein QF694_01355 [Dehalococcoidia bacterium]|nr:hypothetical protein [Dehalococcoidia bacterium]|tara:strand:+ start:2815 stop:3165 length:351 start_codon:yes stop_codon:yes gene_type:complete
MASQASSGNTPKTLANHPYIPTTDSERKEMLSVTGVDSLDGLLGDILAEHRYPHLNLTTGLSEQELAGEFGSMVAENASSSSGFIPLLRAGAYNHYIPSTVRSMLQRGEFVTAYPS